MKHIRIIILVVFAFASLTTCDNEPLDGDFEIGSENNNNGGNNNQTGTFTVDFDGQTFVADQISATIIDDIINISGLRGSNGEAIILTLFGTTADTYELGVQNGMQVNVGAYSTENNTGDTWVAMTDGVESQGQVIISEIDEANLKMSGTFNFTGHDANGNTKEFTNGVFSNVTYTEGLVANNDNEFFALIDGDEFIEDTVNGSLLSVGGMSTISVVATKNSAETIGLTFDSSISPGTYSFAGLGGVPVAQYNASLSEFFVGDGSFTITTHDVANNRIVGEFEFVANELTGGGSHTITQGSFDVTYFN